MRNQPHKPNSSDIARLTGVSRSTVSRVINGYTNVPDETRKMVMDAIEQHGYYPSVSGQILRGKRAHCVGVFLGERGWREETQASLLYAFSECAQSLGYMTLSSRIGDFNTPQCSRTVREILCSGCVDAGVFLNAAGGDSLMKQLTREGQTIGAFGLPPDKGTDGVFTIGLDDGVGRDAAGYTMSLGYEHAALLGNNGSYPDGMNLFKHFLEAATILGLETYRLPGWDALSPSQQAEAALDYLKYPFVMICTDQDAVCAAYRAVASRNLTVGVDVSILGIGLLPTNLPVWPPLSAFRFDSGEMITSLARRIIQALDTPADVPRHEQIPYRWVAGGSCTRYMPKV